MAQKLFLCEGLLDRDLLANSNIASALSSGYVVKDMEGFSIQQRAMCYVLMDKADLTVAAPLFSLEGGEDSVSVTMTCATDGADIYYTVDGTTIPTATATKYAAAATLSATTTIKAIAIKDGVKSEVVTFTYTAPAAASEET